MTEKFQKMVTKFHSFFMLLYTNFKNAMEWKKDEVFAWVIKGLFGGLIIAVILGLKHIMPWLALIVFFIFLIVENRITSPSTPLQVPNYAVTGNTVGELLCRVLYSNFEILNIKKPESFSQIIPVNYNAIKSVNNQVFFRFIIQHSANHEENFNEMRELLNTKICQLLQAGYPNIPYPYYKDLPCVYVCNIENDLLHNNYFSIDVMPILDDNSYCFVKNLIQRQLVEEKNSVNSSSLYDKDF